MVSPDKMRSSNYFNSHLIKANWLQEPLELSFVLRCEKFLDVSSRNLFIIVNYIEFSSISKLHLFLNVKTVCSDLCFLNFCQHVLQGYLNYFKLLPHTNGRERVLTFIAHNIFLRDTVNNDLSCQMEQHVRNNFKILLLRHLVGNSYKAYQQRRQFNSNEELFTRIKLTGHARLLLLFRFSFFLFFLH